jgi:hypothetical protein
MRISSAALAASAAVAAIATLAALPGLADARPFTAGVGIGRTQDSVNADGDASSTANIFGRLGLTNRVGAQIELQKITLPYNELVARSGTLLVVVDLGHSGHLYPIMFGGLGLDHADDGFGATASGSHKEGGFGLEYRADGGFTLGIDLRLGGRSVDQPKDKILPLRNTTGSIDYYQPYTLQEGEYRSGRIYAAIRF